MAPPVVRRRPTPAYRPIAHLIQKDIPIKRLLIAAALLTALGATSAALATSASPISEKVLGAAGISQPYTIPVTKPADVVLAKATVPPGASFGWHSSFGWHYHRGAVVVVVNSGTLTLYDSADRTCTRDATRRGKASPSAHTTSTLPVTKAAAWPWSLSPISA